MADKLDLTAHDIPAALDTALERGRQVALAYVDENGDPVVSFRGSVHVHSPQQLAIWVRKPDSGLTRSIVDRSVLEGVMRIKSLKSATEWTP